MRRRFQSNSFNTEDYLTINSLSDGLNVSFSDEVYFSINGGEWYLLPIDMQTPNINTGDYICFKKYTNEGDDAGIFNISSGSRCTLSGNALSMIYGDNAAGKYSLNGASFSFMFQNCKALEKVSKNFLKAIDLSEKCYDRMFEGCVNLIEAPELPATKLTKYCYYRMFQYCSSLSYIKMLATDILANSCLDDWVYGVSSTGTFVKSKDATWYVRGASGIPNGWTVKTDDEESGVNLISFTIKMNPFVPSMVNYPQQTYQAVEGMTWVEWCASEYNINGFTVVESDIGKRVEHNYDRFVNDGVSSINANDIIISDGVYYYE